MKVGFINLPLDNRMDGHFPVPVPDLLLYPEHREPSQSDLLKPHARPVRGPQGRPLLAPKQGANHQLQISQVCGADAGLYYPRSACGQVRHLRVRSGLAKNTRQMVDLLTACQGGCDVVLCRAIDKFVAIVSQGRLAGNLGGNCGVGIALLATFASLSVRFIWVKV